jgi:hypothetical protein
MPPLMLRAATQARTSGGDSPRASNPHATNPSTAKSIAHRNGNPKFSLFQKLVRQWDEIHPYNAIHVLKVRGQYDLQASRAAWHDALEVLGMGRVNIAGDSFFHECLNGDSIQHTVEPCPPGVTLHAWISRELNRPFCPIDAVPFRPFVIQEPDFFWMGLVYQHWVADSASIREVMREWFVRQYDPRAGRTKPRPWMGGYLALFGPQRSGLEMADGLLAALRSTSQFRRVRRIEDPEMFQDLSAAFMPIPSHPGLIDALRQSARRHGVTVNDFFLAGIAEAANELVPVPRRYRRQDLAVATIVNLRPKVHRPMCDAFGLLLGFTSVCCKPKQLEHWDSLLHSVSAQMRRQKLAGSAQSSWLRLMVGWWAGKMLPPEKVLEFYRKRVSIAGANSNVNLNHAWAARYNPDPILEYHRAPPTGPMTPLVLSTTTLGKTMSIGLTYRPAILPTDKAAEFGRMFAERMNVLAT